MRESYTEGVATHGGREPCVDDPQGRGEASVAVRAGRAIEPRNGQFGVLTLLVVRKAISSTALARAADGPRVVGEPVHVRNLDVREPGGPMLARPADHRAGRSGKAEAARLR
jgi:hypothetical protein